MPPYYPCSIETLLGVCGPKNCPGLIHPNPSFSEFPYNRQVFLWWYYGLARGLQYPPTMVFERFRECYYRWTVISIYRALIRSLTFFSSVLINLRRYDTELSQTYYPVLPS